MNSITIVQPRAETAQGLLAQLRNLADMYQADLDDVRLGDAQVVELSGLDLLLCELAGYTVDLHTGELTSALCVSPKWIGEHDMVLARAV